MVKPEKGETTRINYQPILKISGTPDAFALELKRLEILYRLNDHENKFPVAHETREMKKDKGFGMVERTLLNLRTDIEQNPWLARTPIHINIGPLQLSEKLKQLFIDNIDLKDYLEIEILENFEITHEHYLIILKLHKLGYKIWIDDMCDHSSMANMDKLAHIVSGIKISKPSHILGPKNKLVSQIEGFKHSNPDLLIVLEALSSQADVNSTWNLLQNYSMFVQGFFFTEVGRPEVILESIQNYN